MPIEARNASSYILPFDNTKGLAAGVARPLVTWQRQPPFRYYFGITQVRGSASSRLTFAKERDRGPVWSADGKRISFNRDGDGVFEGDASGAGAETLCCPKKARSPGRRMENI